jgi:hypothetical protein
MRSRERGGGILTARDHQDLGSCMLRLGSIGRLNHFRTSPGPTITPAPTVSSSSRRKLSSTGRCTRRNRCTNCCRRRRHPAVASNGSRRTPTKARSPHTRTIRERVDRLRPEHGHPDEGSTPPSASTVRRRGKVGPWSRGGVLDVPPLRRHELGHQRRRAVLRHGTAQLRDQARPVTRGALQGSRTKHRALARGRLRQCERAYRTRRSSTRVALGIATS